MVKKYIPKQGDVVLVNFNPIKGHEQAGYRPGIVFSNNIFNENTGLIMVCPISSNTKEFPTHYELKHTEKVQGSVLCEHIRSIDYEVRKVKFVEKMNDIDFLNIINLIYACIEE